MRSCAFRGGAWAIGLAFPFAAVCALLYRFPVPFAGYESGLAAMPRASLAVVFYGLLGGFPVLLVVGALGGVAGHVIGGTDVRRVLRLTLAFSAMTALLGVVFMAVLDKLIGPY